MRRLKRARMPKLGVLDVTRAGIDPKTVKAFASRGVAVRCVENSWEREEWELPRRTDIFDRILVQALIPTSFDSNVEDTRR